jgi:hypothetical protein
VTVSLPANIEISDSQQIHLFKAEPQVLGINGYLAVLFGLRTFSLVHIDA